MISICDQKPLHWVKSYFKNKTGPFSTELVRVVKLKEFIEGNEITVVGFFKEKDSDNAIISLELRHILMKSHLVLHMVKNL